MVYVLGLVCVAWTVIELARLAHASPALLYGRRAGDRRPAGARVRRAPLAAWDAEGRPIQVDDVSLRVPR